MKSPIETFSEWVKNGKDDGMEKNHYEPVSKIIELEFFSASDKILNIWFSVRVKENV